MELQENKPKYIAQGLLRYWKRQKGFDTTNSRICPLMEFLKLNYEARHVQLCKRLDLEPLSFGTWLRKPIESVL